MTKIRLPFVHEFVDRHGKVRRYVRLPGRKRVPLHGAPGTEAFNEAYAAALAGADASPAKEIGGGRTAPGTINAGIVSYVSTGLSYYRAWHLTAADGSTLNISPMGNLRTNSGAVLKVAALAGHGLAFLPTYLVGDALQSGRLVTVLDDYTAPPLALRALYPHNRHLSAKVRAFVDFLATRFGQEPPWDSWCRAPSEQTALPAPRRREMIGSGTKPRRSKTRADAP